MTTSLLNLSPLFIIITLSFIFSNEKAYWDLGVIINDDKTTIVQQEVNLDKYEFRANTNSSNNVKALHSNNFIPPVLYELKTSTLSNNNATTQYDDFIYSLSITETIKFIKKSFLKNKYSDFFLTHQMLNNKTTKDDELINSMYIQKLYHSNQLYKVVETLDKISTNDLTDELLFYKIKTDIKLKNYNKAKNNIDLFENTHPNSDLTPYIIYEKKLLINKNEK